MHCLLSGFIPPCPRVVWQVANRRPCKSMHMDRASIQSIAHHEFYSWQILIVDYPHDWRWAGQHNSQSICEMKSLWPLIVTFCCTSKLCGHVVCSAGMEQSASTDQDRLLSDNIPASNQGLSFPSVIRLLEVYHCPISRWRTKPERVFLILFVNLCKVPCNVLWLALPKSWHL